MLAGDVVPEALQTQDALVLEQFSNEITEELSEDSDSENDDTTYAEVSEDDTAPGEESENGGGNSNGEEPGVMPELCSA